MEHHEQSNALPDTLSAVEHIKAGSRHLRGTIEEGLAEEITGAISDDDSQITKFHGIYLYDDRDLRLERQEQKLEPLYRFMVRVRVPGGICTPKQWLALDAIAREHGNSTLRLTSRQAVQFHGIIKRNLKTSVASINDSLLDTIAACGDVNRNVLCSSLPEQSRIHAATYGWANRISEHLTPKTSAYHEIWLNEDKVVDTANRVEDSEPIYGHTYLPRKFKIALAVPPVNDVDVFAHDLGLIAIVRNGRLTGFNIAVGGGLGMSHTDHETYPRIADVIGSCTPKQVIAVAEAIVTTQRDFGNREHRHLSRLKYTIDERGLDWFVGELEQRLGFALGPAAKIQFDHTGDRFGWTQSEDGKLHLTLAIANGRVEDRGDNRWMTGLRELALNHRGSFRLTANQNLIVSGISKGSQNKIDRIVSEYGLDSHSSLTPVRLNALACVALPTCSQAMADAERIMPELMTHLEVLFAQHGIQDEPIVVRVTGCPNGCARPTLAEIGLVGKGPGRYNLHLGASHSGDRLNSIYRENEDLKGIIAALDPVLAHFASERLPGERFGDYVVRAGFVPAVAAGREVRELPLLVGGSR